MKKQTGKRILALVLGLIMLVGIAPFAFAQEKEESEAYTYYYNQLKTNEAREIYKLLTDLYENGKLLSGVYTVDLVAEGVLANKQYDKNALMADFSSARDAFMLDYNAFYVDFDKLSITQTQSSANDYVITMGIGRDTTYLRDGFTSGNTASAVKAFDAVVNEIAGSADKQDYLDERVKFAYSEIVKRVDYALEADAKEENVLYVRTSYGALVKGEAVCEGYARALKAVLDTMDIDNVLVQGMFADGDKLQPHMWNYVKMDDNRWYLLDTTMEDGVSSLEAEVYFLKNGLADEVKYYQPDGVISLSENSFEFRYPDLSAVEYARLSTDFTAEEIIIEGENGPEVDTTKKNISYHGKGLAKTQETGKYVLASFDNETWYYYERYVQTMYALQNGGTLGALSEDYDTYFVDIFYLAYFAVTTVAPTAEFDSSSSSEMTKYYTYASTSENLAAIEGISRVAEVIEFSKVAPVAVMSTPSNSRLSGGMEYDVSITYSEKLVPANPALPIGVKAVNTIPGAAYGDFSFDGDKTVYFKMTTVDTYNFVVSYFFALENLVGESSLLAPNAVGFNVVNNPSFACPKIAGDINVAYANTPALISDSNLDDNDWLDKDGNSIGENLPARLSLVATTITGTQSESMEAQVESDLGYAVEKAQTFELTLGLCSNQISYVYGKRIKVFVPFPDGYSAETENVSFKAFHFNQATGEVEEIDCVTTDKGIIMMCDSFSPFMVAAVQKTADEKKLVITNANGYGQFNMGDELDVESLYVEAGATEKMTVVADDGYVIESITVNGIAVAVTNNRSMEVVLSSDSLSDSGNIVEASFILEDIKVGTADEDTTDKPEDSKPEQDKDNDDTAADCDCICHKDNFFSKLIRWIFNLLSKLFRTDIKCCADM